MDTKKLRQKILDLAIRGKLVPQDPNDEPASVLIEKIRAEKEQLIKEKKIKRDKNESYIYRSDKSYYEQFADGTVKCIDDEIPFEIPGSWEWCRLKTVLSKLTDGTHHSPANEPIGDYMYITAKNIKSDGIVLNDITYVSEEIHNEIYTRCNPEKGDILYIKDGATTGIATINSLSNPFSMLSSVALLKPMKYLNNRYLLGYLQSPICYNFTRNSMKGVGITRVTLTQMEHWLIPIAPLKEQERIVKNTDDLFTVIIDVDRNKDELSDYISQTKSKILDLAIRGKLVPQDPNDEPASVLLERIKSEHSDSKKKAKNTGDNSHYQNLEWSVPSNWCWCLLSDVCTFERGITFPSTAKTTLKEEHLLPCIRTANVQEGLELEDLWYIDPVYIKNNTEKLVRNGDIIMSSANSRELVGKTSFVHNVDYNMTFGGFVLNIRARGIEPKYLFYLLRCYFNNGIFMTESTQTTNIANINATVLGNLKMPLPPIHEQKKIVQTIEKLFRQLESIVVEL